MDTIAAAVTGARHLRSQRNGQDAAVALASGAASPAVVVVADGCSSGAGSEVGAQLGATLFARALAARLNGGACVTCAETWAAVRGDVGRALWQLLESVPGDRERAIHDMFLFTIVAAAATRDGAAVWALGDGVYSFVTGSGAARASDTRVLGPFADNAPPYLGYDLLGDAREARFDVAPADCDAIVIATDGALDLDADIARFADTRFLAHPDALRRELAILARANERIDWDERRVVRTPAMLQDDCAIGVVRWRAA